MASTLKLEIVTPEAKVYSEEVDSVRLPGAEGELGIYPNHAPLMAQVKAGELIAHKGGEESILAVGHGFVEITGDHVAILTDNAADSADIDEAAAEDGRGAADDARHHQEHPRAQRQRLEQQPPPRRVASRLHPLHDTSRRPPSARAEGRYETRRARARASQLATKGE